MATTEKEDPGLGRVEGVGVEQVSCDTWKNGGGEIPSSPIGGLGERI